jgi:ankyrin repeat protein
MAAGALCLHLLLSGGADAQEVTASRRQAASIRLLQAIEQDDIAGVRELLAHGASANAADDRGRSALMWAASRADIPLCQLLLQHHARLNGTDQDGETALSIAMRRGGDYGVRPEGALRPRPDEAAYVATAFWLVKHGADVNLSGGSDANLLLVARANLRRWPEMCQSLLRHGAGIRGRNPHGLCILDYAALAGNVPLLTQLLQKHPAQADRDSALLTAVGGTAATGVVRLMAKPQQASIRLLLAAGAHPNITDGEGYSLLQLAVYARDREAAQLLIRHGANLNFKHKRDNYTPLSTARWLHDEPMQALLQNAGAK